MDRADEKQLVGRAVAGDREALEAVIERIQDDIYNLAIRMLGDPDAAADATQEILLQIITHLAQWRGEAALATWVWKIAVRHVLRIKKSQKEEMASFEGLEQAIAAGQLAPPAPSMSEAELAVLEKELRLDCTMAMILSLDRDHRIAWILGEVFGLESPAAAEVLDVDAATYRKRLQRARTRFGRWMHGNCGLANPENPCNCRRQVSVALAHGYIDPARLKFAAHRARARVHLRVIGEEADAIARAADVLSGHPSYAAPERLIQALRDLIHSRQWRMFDA